MAGRFAAVGVLAVLALAGCGGGSADEPSAANGAVVELAGVDALRSAFSAGKGTARLVLLLSPT